KTMACHPLTLGSAEEERVVEPGQVEPGLIAPEARDLDGNARGPGQQVARRVRPRGDAEGHAAAQARVDLREARRVVLEDALQRERSDRGQGLGDLEAGAQEAR